MSSFVTMMNTDKTLRINSEKCYLCLMTILYYLYFTNMYGTNEDWWWGCSKYIFHSISDSSNQ